MLLFGCFYALQTVKGTRNGGYGGTVVIVAVVMNLPTTGPLLLRALLVQDMYLAGSLILVVSLLTVIGTLVSDVLLAWVDPRIRYQ